MEKSKDHVRHCLLYGFQQHHSARAAAGNICRYVGRGLISYVTASRWFNRFKGRDYSLEDQPRSGRPVEVDLDRLETLIESDPRHNTRCLAFMLGCSQSTIERHLVELGFRSILNVWVPYDLTVSQKNQRMDICTSLLSKKRNFGWLDNLITGDEKWVLYINNYRQRSWVRGDQRPEPTPKPGPHPKKIMLSVWWGVRGIAHWELLPHKTTITTEFYFHQLDRLKAKLESMRPQQSKVYFLHDNARPHVALSTRKKLLSFGWDILPHPPYSPDLAPTDYYLFRTLSNSLRDQVFSNDDDLRANIDEFFSSCSQEFYSTGIHSLPERWRRVVDNDGTYILD